MDLSMHLVDHLSGNGLPVGFCQAPDAGGWDGQPNLQGSKFVGYATVWPLTATQSSGPLGDAQADWQMPYQVITYGIDPNQTENQADKTRIWARRLERQSISLDGEQWYIQQVRVTSIGAMARNDNFDPPQFSQVDVLTLWISKEL